MLKVRLRVRVLKMVEAVFARLFSKDEAVEFLLGQFAIRADA
jgi:hypothetical protein